MQRFILRENIKLFEASLTENRPGLDFDWMQLALASARREFALLEAATRGAKSDSVISPRRSQVGEIPDQVAHYLKASSDPLLLIDAGPGLTLVDMTDAYATLIGLPRDSLVGKTLFEAFPEDPCQPLADGAANLLRSLKTAAETRQPHVMDPQRYDVAGEDGRFVERYWQPINTPIVDAAGRVIYILNRPCPVQH